MPNNALNALPAERRDPIIDLLCLQATGGNRMAAARLLQISRASLYERLARWPDLEVQLSDNA